MRPRLAPQRLAVLPTGVERPRYPREALRCGIVHLGVGAFQRAHMAVATEAALNAGALGQGAGFAARASERDSENSAHWASWANWGMAGVSLRSAGTRDALAPQQGLYTVSIRDADAAGRPREALQVVGCLRELLVAPENPAAVLERLAHAHTRIVSLTVTEKAYAHDPATGLLNERDPRILHDLAHPDAPCSAVGFIVRGLALRRVRGLAPVTLMSLDNLPANGRLLQGLVLAFAERVDAALAAWIARECSFPNSMVDRIVPRTTEADRKRVAEALGLHDAWPVLGEPFFDWAVEDRFVAGRPAWGAAGSGGVRFVEAAGPWERLKLRMVNGTHSALAYLAAQAGWRTVDEAVAQAPMRAYLLRLMREEIEPTLGKLQGFDLAGYRESLLARYANPALAHRTRQIAMDGSQKLPQRLLATVRERRAAGASVDLLGLALAGWLHDLRGFDEAGAAHAIDDPLAEALQARLAEADREPNLVDTVRAMCGYAPVFGNDLAAQPALVDAVANHLRLLRAQGVRAALEAVAR